MIRNLKTLIIAAMAVAALSAVAGSSAKAHTPATFHCAVAPCVVTMMPDGPVPSTTSHIVFDIVVPPGISVPMTCNQYTEEGTLTEKTVTSYTLRNIRYHGCIFLGQEAKVDTNECVYHLTAEGKTTIECPGSKAIEITGAKCTIAIPSQGPLSGVVYHNIKPGAFKEVTVETLLNGIETTATGAGCPGTGTSKTSSITTGNGILTAEEDKLISNMVDFSWSATVP